MKIQLKKYVAYDPVTFEFKGFYNEGRKDLPEYVDEIDPDTFMSQIGQHTHYNPITKTFYTPEADIQAKAEAEELSWRNTTLTDTDKYVLIDFPITRKEQQEMKRFRQELRDYPDTRVKPIPPDVYNG